MMTLVALFLRARKSPLRTLRLGRVFVTSSPSFFEKIAPYLVFYLVLHAKRRSGSSEPLSERGPRDAVRDQGQEALDAAGYTVADVHVFSHA